MLFLLVVYYVYSKDDLMCIGSETRNKTVMDIHITMNGHSVQECYLSTNLPE